MLVTELVRKIVNEYDYSLKTDEKIVQFRESCLMVLLPYEGDVLKEAWMEILTTHDKVSHPKLAKIKDICNNIKTKKFAEKNQHDPEAIKEAKIKTIIDAFKKTDRFIWCCKNMIAHDVIVYIQKNCKLPDKEVIERALGSTKETKERYEELHNKQDFSGFDAFFYKCAGDLIQANQNYYDEFNTD